MEVQIAPWFAFSSLLEATLCLSRRSVLQNVLLTLSYKLALIAIRSALCTLHKPRLSLHKNHRQRRPTERKFGTAPIEVATRPAATGLPT